MSVSTLKHHRVLNKTVIQLHTYTHIYGGLYYKMHIYIYMTHSLERCTTEGGLFLSHFLQKVSNKKTNHTWNPVTDIPCKHQEQENISWCKRYVYRCDFFWWNGHFEVAILLHGTTVHFGSRNATWKYGLFASNPRLLKHISHIFQYLNLVCTDVVWFLQKMNFSFIIRHLHCNTRCPLTGVSKVACRAALFTLIMIKFHVTNEKNV